MDNYGANEDGGRWYFSRKELEDDSPSRRDNIGFKKEAYLRKSYSTYLQILGMRLKTIATVCMFLAGKVEETPRTIKDVILVSYEIRHEKDPEAAHNIRQKEVYEQQKELILIGERVVLGTLGFDLNVQHAYKPLLDAIKKFKVAQNALAQDAQNDLVQVAWNFVNDGLRTSLCLQFKPHHIAAMAIFLAAKFLRVKLPSIGEKVWWQELNVSPRQMEEVSIQMLELYEQNKLPPSANNDAEGSTVSGVTQQATPKDSPGKEEPAVTNSHSQAGAITSRPGTSKSMSHADNPGVAQRTMVAQANDYDSGEMKIAFDQNADDEAKGNIDSQIDTVGHHENVREAQTMSKITSRGKEDEERNATRGEIRKLKDKHFGQNFGNREGTLGQSPQDAIKKFDKDKVKAALEKRKKSQGAVTRKTDILDEDDLIERELEAGIEQAAKSKKNRSDKRQNWSRHFERQEHEKHQEDGEHQGMKEHIEEVPDNINKSIPPRKSNNRKRKLWSSPDTTSEGRLLNDYAPGAHHYESHDHLEVRRRGSRLGDVEREHKRHVPENHM